MNDVSTIPSIKQRCASGDSVAQITRDEGGCRSPRCASAGIWMTVAGAACQEGARVEARLTQADDRLVAHGGQEAQTQAAAHGHTHTRC